MKKWLISSVFLITILLLLYGFLFGPLFPYSPVKIGFTTTAFERYTLIYPKNAELPQEYREIDPLIKETERFHKLTFNKPLRIIVCATVEQYKRFLVFGGGRACTLETGTVIYTSPLLQQATYPPRVEIQKNQLVLTPEPDRPLRDMASFFKHELSHALIYQNTSLFKALKMKRWFEEGLAVSFGNPHHYYHGQELKTLAITQGYFFNLLDNKAEPKDLPDGIKYFFMYGMYAGFMQYLIKTYGEEHMLEFTHEYIHAPDQEEHLFEIFFGTTPQEALKQFQQNLS